MSVSAAAVKELRDKTGAGVLDCRAALTESGGDMEKAAGILRQRGVAMAEKKAGRETRQGLVEAYIHPGGRYGALVEVNCETDFVARTDTFKELARDGIGDEALTRWQLAAHNGIAQRVIHKHLLGLWLPVFCQCEGHFLVYLT